MGRAEPYHVLHLSSVHPADDVRVFAKEAVTAAAAGHRVELFAKYPRCEEKEGVSIRPVPPAETRVARMLRLPWWLFCQALQRRGNVHQLHDSELLPMGIALQLLGKTVVYDVHEDLPAAILTKHWISPPLRRLVAAAAWLLETAALPILSGFIPATPAIARRFRRRPMQVVQNLPKAEEYLTHGVAGSRPVDEFRLAYIGVLSEPRGALQMLDALILTPPHFRLHIMGVVSPESLLERMKQHPGWERVIYYGHRTRGEATQLLMSAHAGVVLFHPEPNHVEAQPNKLFEYMASALPVIASDFPLWRELVSRERCGALVDPLDPRAIARAMGALADEPLEAKAMGQRGQAAVFSRLNWSHEGRQLLEFYRRLVDGRYPPVI